MTAPSIRQIKQQLKNQSQQLTSTASDSALENKLPPFWLTDWLLYVIKKPAIFLITDDDYQLTTAEFEQFSAGVTKMQQGIPLAYLTGYQEFWSLDFMVNEHTLIPRPDTEVLVEQVLHWIKAQDGAGSIKEQSASANSKRLLDLGTGSGCIAISLAHEWAQDGASNTLDHWQIVAVDVSQEVLAVARHNAAVNNITNIEFIQSSWYQKLATDSASLFKVIVSNPPYIDETDAHLAHLQAEPISALSAPNNGLSDIEQIIQQAPKHLQRGGLLAIEHGFDQGAAVRQLFFDNGFTTVSTVQDFGGNERVTLGQFL